MRTSKTKKTISRRSVLTGGAGALALTALPVSAFAGLQGRVLSSTSRRPRSYTLAKHLCENVHEKMATKLDAIMCDSLIGYEEQEFAFANAHCPGCGNHVHPAATSNSITTGAIV